MRPWRNWQTRKIKDLVENYLGGSSNLLGRIIKVRVTIILVVIGTFFVEAWLMNTVWLDCSEILTLKIYRRMGLKVVQPGHH